ncbi:MAG: cysteine desulfurase [Lachnospiraceae bacterium]|nr:cysteine desulfurase [Lachnospiraceae bacterium]
MTAYLDNSATTRCFDEVREYMSEIMDKYYGNPSSMHMVGVEAEKHVRYATDIFAGLLKVDPKEIVYTSGGTESDNLALIGCAGANARAGRHIITTKIEHPAVLETCAYLEKEGYEVTYLDVDESGLVRADDLKAALREDTILVSVMYVNNEIGSLQPIGELGRIIKEYDKNILFHVDAVQGFGKVRINPKKEKIDLLSVSGHKIHGPKGVGILYVNKNVKINPIMFGGGQQKGLRSGTENVPGIAGMAKAAELIYTDFDKKMDRLYELKTYFISELMKLEGITINGLPGYETAPACDEKTDTGIGEPEEAVRKTAPHIVSASVEGIRAEVLLHALEEKGIYVSSGSACASNKPAISATLKEIGVKQNLLDSTIRFSMSVETSKEELDLTLETLKEVLPKLRRFTRR